MHTISLLVILGLALLLLLPGSSFAKESLRILTWNGYVTAADISAINALLAKQGYDIEALVIAPYAEGSEQMYRILRKGKADISFLTLFFIGLQGGQAAKLIQPINTASPRLGNYRHLLGELTRIPMGMRGDKPLYIPFAGGSYGFYADRNKVSADDLPHAWGDLFKPRWKGKYSLNKTQVWYNVAIASMALGKPPYYVNDMVNAGPRDKFIQETRDDGPLAAKLADLYQGAGNFWDTGTQFNDALEIVSSWGPEIAEANSKGGNWQLIQFKEGELVWVDTINFAKSLSGKRLEAAEIIANYFIGKEVQSRVAKSLSLVAVSSLAASNPILTNNPEFFRSGTFVPPYRTQADNGVKRMSDKALKMLVPQAAK